METVGPRYNFYDILEISPFCAQHEITAAYEKAKATYSGDNQAIYTMFSEEEARDLLRLVEEAYAVLGNKTLRALYDEKLGHSPAKKVDVSFDSLKTESRTMFNPAPSRNKNAMPAFQVDEEFERTIAATENWNGEELKKVREYKRITLDKMSEITRITPFYVNAIEEMDASKLPAIVFVRGYVGQMAKVLGLNEKKVCDSYMTAFKQKIGTK